MVFCIDFSFVFSQGLFEISVNEEDGDSFTALRDSHV